MVNKQLIIWQFLKIFFWKNKTLRENYVDENIEQRFKNKTDEWENAKQLILEKETSTKITKDKEFNDEYSEIKKELELSGEKFVTETDTEVVLRAYKKWGKDCLNKFNGMFAIVIWDIKNEELFLARDRFGVKPLYYLFLRRNYFLQTFCAYMCINFCCFTALVP